MDGPCRTGERLASSSRMRQQAFVKSDTVAEATHRNSPNNFVQVSDYGQTVDGALVTFDRLSACLCLCRAPNQTRTHVRRYARTAVLANLKRCPSKGMQALANWH